MIQMCTNCFPKTLDESNKFITNVTAMSQTSDFGITSGDNMSCREAYNNMKDAGKTKAIQHIKSVIAYKTHYTRDESNKMNLPSYYTLYQNV
jgi:hypothetical protein